MPRPSSAQPIWRDNQGPPDFVPTDDERQLVENMSAFGVPQEGIASLITRLAPGGVLIPISKDQLQRHFASELVTGLPKLIGKLANSLFLTALDRKHPSHAAAAMFMLKTRARWTERVAIDANINFEALAADFEGATEEELAVLAKYLLRKASGGGSDGEGGSGAPLRIGRSSVADKPRARGAGAGEAGLDGSAPGGDLAAGGQGEVIQAPAAPAPGPDDDVPDAF